MPGARKESRPKGPGFELPLEGDCFEKPKRSYWSAGVMEYLEIPVGFSFNIRDIGL